MAKAVNVEKKSLKDFLAENTVESVYDEVVISKRIPYAFKIKAMTGKERDNYRNAAKRTISGKLVFDENKFQKNILIGQTIDPAFNDQAFIDSLHVATPVDALDKVLLAGEQEELFQQIAKLSGFDTPGDEKVKEAKN